MFTSLEVTFSAEGEYSEDLSNWINMQQEESPACSNVPKDLLSMYASASSGLTAYSQVIDSSIASFTNTEIIVPLTFYLFPSSLDLPYSLSVNQGILSSRRQVETPKVGNIVVPMSTLVEFSYLTTVNSIEFVSDCYNTNGEVIPPPAYEIKESALVFAEPIFAVLRVNILAKGYEYKATLTFPKNTEGTSELFGVAFSQTFANQITNTSCSVIASYSDKNGDPVEELLTLEIPDCIADILEECPGGFSVADPCAGDLDINRRVTIYYSVCTGEVLYTDRQEYDPCEDVE